jgi:hypothetical protein
MRQSEDKYVGAEALKAKHKDYLDKLEAWAKAGKWENMQGPMAHFDWWMFPIAQDSRGQGKRYTMDKARVEELKKDAAFMANYRRAVFLVVQSWGWDLQNNKDISNATQKWTGYSVRLWKMVESLKFFGEQELYVRVQKFIRAKKISV